MLSTLYAIARPGLSVRLSTCLCVRLTYGWISQKQLKLVSCNFHHRASSFCSMFNPEILTVSPWMGASHKGGVEKTSYFLALCINISTKV